MIDIKSETKMKALTFFKVDKLPEKEDGKDIWIRAIALVTRTNSKKSYVCVEKDYKSMKNIVIADFCYDSGIFKIEEYYPVSYLKKMFLHPYSTKKKEERIKYLSIINPGVDYSNYSLEELDNETKKDAIKIQLQKEKI